MKHLLGVIVLSLLTGSMRGQQQFSLDCPDPEAKQACNSFKEDKKTVQWVQDGTSLVCFRQNVDEYFTVGAMLWGKRKNPDGSVTEEGFAAISLMNHGVEDDVKMPFVLFKVGEWKLDDNVLTRSDADSGVRFAGDTVDFFKNYKGIKGDSVNYYLRIDLDTKRFHETWQSVDGKKEEGFGRCLVNTELWNAKFPK